MGAKIKKNIKGKKGGKDKKGIPVLETNREKIRKFMKQNGLNSYDAAIVKLLEDSKELVQKKIEESSKNENPVVDEAQVLPRNEYEG